MGFAIFTDQSGSVPAHPSAHGGLIQEFRELLAVLVLIGLQLPLGQAAQVATASLLIGLSLSIDALQQAIGD